MNDNTEQLLSDPAMVEKAFDDPEIRKLPVGSPEFNAALVDSSKMDSDDGADDAPAGDDTDQDEADDSETTDERPVKKSRSRDGRIDELTATVSQLRRELETKRVVEEQASGRAPAASKEEPVFGDFDSIAEYTKAMATWQYGALKEQEAYEVHQRELEEQSQAVRETWKQREAEVRKEHRNYNDVVTVHTLTAINPSPEARLYLGECDNGPLTVFTLLSDKELAEKFTTASPTKQVAMLAKLEVQLEDSSESGVKTTIASRAAEPPRSLPSGRSSAPGRNILEHAHEMSFEEFDRQMSAYERNRKGKR